MIPKPIMRFYTVAQVAELLEVSTRSLRRWIADGELRHHRLGRQVRILESDLRAFLEERRAP
jgi:excisionase family DNA binding protein